MKNCRRCHSKDSIVIESMDIERLSYNEQLLFNSKEYAVSCYKCGEHTPKYMEKLDAIQAWDTINDIDFQ